MNEEWQDWDNEEISEQREWWRKEQEAEWEAEAASREEPEASPTTVLPDLLMLDR